MAGYSQGYRGSSNHGLGKVKEGDAARLSCLFPACLLPVTSFLSGACTRSRSPMTISRPLAVLIDGPQTNIGHTQTSTTNTS